MTTHMPTTATPAAISAATLLGADVTFMSPTGVAVTDTAALSAAITAASARVTSTSRRQIIQFQSGTYRYYRTGTNTFDLTGLTGISFVGADGFATELLMSGSAASANWRLFYMDTCSDIEIRNLVIDGSELTTMDTVADQVHPIQIGPGSSHVRVVECRFQNFADGGGDGIRLIGDKSLGWVSDVTIDRCEFTNIWRSGVSFQRFCRRVIVRNCRGYGTIHGGWIDFEPTGWILDANTGSTSTLIVDIAETGKATPPNFTVLGVAVGDTIRNKDESKWATVTAVNSATSLTTSAVTSWLQDDYYVPANIDHLITGNVFDNTLGDVEGAIAISGSHGLIFSNNVIINGIVDAVHVTDCQFIGNRIVSGRRSLSTTHGISFSGGCDGITVANNRIVMRNSVTTSARSAIKAVHSATSVPGEFTIAGNRIRMECEGIGLEIESCKQLQIIGNTITKAEPSSASSGVVGIRIKTTSATLSHCIVSGNILILDNAAAGGRWLDALQLSAATNNITQAIVTGNSFESGTNGIDMTESSGGVFTRPPFVSNNVLSSTSAMLVLPASSPWIQLSGNAQDGSGGTTYAPADYWGDGVPAFSAPNGSTARRRDGIAGTTYYIRIGGAWTAVH